MPFHMCNKEKGSLRCNEFNPDGQTNDPLGILTNKGFRLFECFIVFIISASLAIAVVDIYTMNSKINNLEKKIDKALAIPHTAISSTTK